MKLTEEKKQGISKQRQFIYGIVEQYVSSGKVNYISNNTGNVYIENTECNIKVYKNSPVIETDAQGKVIISDIKRTAYHIVIASEGNKYLESDICISFSQQKKPSGILYYLHGGGFWLNGLAETDAKISEAIAKGANYLLINMSYPISPEHTIPEINHYIHLAHKTIELYLPQLIEGTLGEHEAKYINTQLNNLPRALVALSAGCTPAIYMAATSDKKFDSISFVSPLVDLTKEAMDLEESEPKGAGLSLEDIITGNNYALGEAVSPKDPTQFIAHRSLTELYTLFNGSHLMVAWGENEVLRNSSQQFSNKLKAAGLAVKEFIHKDKLHGDFQKPGNEISHEITKLLQGRIKDLADEKVR